MDKSILDEMNIEELEERVEFSTTLPTCCERCVEQVDGSFICYDEP